MISKYMEQMKTNYLQSILYQVYFLFSTKFQNCLYFREAPHMPFIFITNNKTGEVLVSEQTERAMEHW